MNDVLARIAATLAHVEQPDVPRCGNERCRRVLDPAGPSPAWCGPDCQVEWMRRDALLTPLPPVPDLGRWPLPDGSWAMWRADAPPVDDTDSAWCEIVPGEPDDDGELLGWADEVAASVEAKTVVPVRSVVARVLRALTRPRERR